MAIQLSAGEHVLFEGHPSWRSTLAFYIQGLLGIVLIALVVAGITRVAGDEVNTGLVILIAVVLFVAELVVGYVRRIATTYTITNRRLHIKRGIVSRRTQEARLERVQNVNTDQSVIERLLRVGSVDFDTAGTDDHGFKFEGVDSPLEVVEAVDRAQREYAAEHSGSGRLGADPSAPGGGL